MLLIAALACAVVMSSANPTHHVDCDNINQHIRTHCYPASVHDSFAEWCADNEAMTDALNCALQGIGVCNPHAIPFFPTDEEIQFSIAHQCAAGDNLRHDCAAQYIHNPRVLGACMPGQLQQMAESGYSERCKRVMAGFACGVRDVRACDSGTADILLAASQPQANRLCTDSSIGA